MPISLRAIVLAMSITACTMLCPRILHAQPCNALYVNGARLTSNGGANAAYTNNVVLCNGDQNFGGVNSYSEVYFNLTTHVPNYVAYCVDPARYTAMTTGWWVPSALQGYGLDPRIDPGNQATRKFLYGNTKLQVGHMFPHSSSLMDPYAMGYANYMTNMAPQVGALNGGQWKNMEGYIRGLGQFGAVYVIVGPVYLGAPAAAPTTWLPAGYPTVAVTPANPTALPDRFFALIYQPAQPGIAAQVRLAYSFPNRKVQYNSVINNWVDPGGLPGLPGLKPFYVVPGFVMGTIMANLPFNPPAANDIVSKIVNGSPGAAAGNNCGSPIP